MLQRAAASSSMQGWAAHPERGARHRRALHAKQQPPAVGAVWVRRPNLRLQEGARGVSRQERREAAADGGVGGPLAAHPPHLHADYHVCLAQLHPGGARALRNHAQLHAQGPKVLALAPVVAAVAGHARSDPLDLARADGGQRHACQTPLGCGASARACLRAWSVCRWADGEWKVQCNLPWMGSSNRGQHFPMQFHW